MNKKSYSISAIHCKHCAHTIKMELSELEGVSEVSVDIDAKTIEVNYKLPASEEEIKGLLAEINYPVDK